jgi:hypothetical protein
LIASALRPRGALSSYGYDKRGAALEPVRTTQQPNQSAQLIYPYPGANQFAPLNELTNRLGISRSSAFPKANPGSTSVFIYEFDARFFQSAFDLVSRCLAAFRGF